MLITRMSAMIQQSPCSVHRHHVHKHNIILVRGGVEGDETSGRGAKSVGYNYCSATILVSIMPRAPCKKFILLLYGNSGKKWAYPDACVRKSVGRVPSPTGEYRRRRRRVTGLGRRELPRRLSRLLLARAFR